MIASLYVFCCCMFPTLGCIVCVFLQPLQTIQTLFYQEIAYFYTFFYFFFRLKFSKTPFHVVLSKNKTNTKKKISFLIINFCFFPQFTVFNSVHKCEPFTPKTNGSRVCFCYFLRGFHFFHSFFLDFFFILLLKYTFLHQSAHGSTLQTPFFCILLSFPPSCRQCCLVSLNTRARTFHYNDWFSVLH